MERIGYSAGIVLTCVASGINCNDCLTLGREDNSLLILSANSISILLNVRHGEELYHHV